MMSKEFLNSYILYDSIIGQMKVKVNELSLQLWLWSLQDSRSVICDTTVRNYFCNVVKSPVGCLL